MSNRPQSTTWTEDRKLVVAELLREGLSAGQMSKRLGISRNAIISVIHRDKMLSEIGLRAGVGGARQPKAESSPYKSGRMKTAARSPARYVQSAPVVVPVAEPEPVFICEDVAEIETPIDPLGLPLADLNLRQCRFAVNNAAKGEQHLFCGHPVKIGSSFCEHHHRRVFVRPTKAGVA
ncbi:GcrA family cell cycle regulator [Brucella pseudogrignonensis]|uniref:GcrA cell cycle regulator family protein n=1 Tax=Brucella pseudogrignonensis TaxID=419475 RepID=A0A256GMS3_9HYPH|nr:GcrA family cell cycle regulator [Brucella pseudogrignonensis]OYR28457.1 gcrA cell cycle regulator family protein [Brucella pseudogrignonensis]